MRVAFTQMIFRFGRALILLDGYSVASIVQKMSDALVRNRIRNVYGYGNSWSLAQHPELARCAGRVGSGPSPGRK